jgi:hypothetical protein
MLIQKQEKSKPCTISCKYNDNGISYLWFPLRVLKKTRIKRYKPSCTEVMYILYINPLTPNDL